MSVTTLKAASLEDIANEVSRRYAGRTDAELRAAIADLDARDLGYAADILREIVTDRKLAIFPAEPGCVHEELCRAEWAQPGQQLVRHHWPALAVVDLGGLMVTLTPMVMVEANEPVKQEHVELEITLDDQILVKEPITVSVDVRHAKRLIAALQKAVRTLPQVSA